VIWGWCDDPQIRRSRAVSLATTPTERKNVPPTLREDCVAAIPYRIGDLAYVDESIYIRSESYLHGASMPINVNNAEADALTRRFAHMAGVSITEAIVIAMKEAIERRRDAESPLQTAARLREKHGVSLRKSTKKPLPREAFDRMWESE
jgi:antitoxin VapB